jgi:CrcB protein
MLHILIVAAGGALGSVARYGLSGLVHRYVQGTFPWGTLAVNVLGCLAIGVALHHIQDRQSLGPNARLFLTIGILGGFTTFSSFGYETVQLAAGGQWGAALGNILGNVALGLGAVWLGWIGARALTS